MNINPKHLFLAAAVAGILSAAPLATSVARADDPTGTCAEKNGCQGQGHCAGVAAGKQHDCSGKNACTNNVIAKTTKAQCDGYGGNWQP